VATHTLSLTHTGKGVQHANCCAGASALWKFCLGGKKRCGHRFVAFKKCHQVWCCKYRYVAAALQHTTTHCNNAATTLQQHRSNTVTRCNTLPRRRLFHDPLRYILREPSSVMLQMWVCGRSTATHCNTLRESCNKTATQCITLQHTATHCNTVQHTATHCNTLQQDWLSHDSLRWMWNKVWLYKYRYAVAAATYCITLRHTATHCNNTATILQQRQLSHDLLRRISRVPSSAILQI